MQRQFIVEWLYEGEGEFEAYYGEDVPHVISQWQDMRQSCEDSDDVALITAVRFTGGVI